MNEEQEVYTEGVDHFNPASERHMTVSDAIRILSEYPKEALLLICAHAFPGMEDQAWYVSHFAPSEDRSAVVVEGAGPQSE